MTEPTLAISTPHGRQYVHPVSGAWYPSVTNVIDTLAKPWLAGWKAKMVAGHAWDQREALMKIDDREAAVDMLKGGPTRARNVAARVGDLIHSYAEAVAKEAAPPDIPPELESHVAPFRTFLEEFLPSFRVLEGTVFHGGPNDEDRYAGSFDFLADISDFSVLGDYKSGGDRVYAEVALQLAALRHGDELWDEATGNLHPMPHVDSCIAVHLRPSKLAVHLIDAGETAFRAFLGLRAAWPWDKDHTGAVGPRMNLERLVKELRRPETLTEQLEQSVEETSASPSLGGEPLTQPPVTASPVTGQRGSGEGDAEDSPAAETESGRQSSQRSAGHGDRPVPVSLPLAGGTDG